MKRNVVNNQSVKASTTDLSQLGKMFVYIALCQLRHSTNSKCELVSYATLMPGAIKLVECLDKMGYVKPIGEEGQWDFVITKAGGELVVRYLATCAEELRRGRFGKMKWDKRSKFHQAILARLG